ncbi:protein SLOW GREEN 1, chloroplastic isoform X2 [Henckelia pumila]|uniref:protein SLOW GREEN 1, chloroplastic isoform X2 n=1 Tax=Henckelia pumila TaxID=405737 RepID=UPI003C6E3067
MASYFPSATLSKILRSPLHHHARLRFQVPSKPSLLPFLLLPKRRISQVCAKKLATLLVGSLIFMGSLKSRPVLAVPVQETERFERRRDGEEELMCLRLLRENPTNIEALKMVVNVKMKRGKTDEAVGFVEMLMELQPNEMEWRLLQALCYEMMGDLAKAKSLFHNILKQKPFLLRALHGLAIVMHKNGEGDAVFEMLQKALEFAQRDKRVDEARNICILVAQMHVIKGDLEEALEKFQVLIDENPRDFRPYLCQLCP